MKDIIADKSLVASCGLYCGSCRKYLQEKCPGCKKNEKASWCKVRTCCLENDYTSCADCKEFEDPNQCKKFNNFMSKFFGFIFRSDKKACIDLIKEKGYQNFTQHMAREEKMTIKK